MARPKRDEASKAIESAQNSTFPNELPQEEKVVDVSVKSKSKIGRAHV